jgi:hypothetical protein
MLALKKKGGMMRKERQKKGMGRGVPIRAAWTEPGTGCEGSVLKTCGSVRSSTRVLGKASGLLHGKSPAI